MVDFLEPDAEAEDDDAPEGEGDPWFLEAAIRPELQSEYFEKNLNMNDKRKNKNKRKPFFSAGLTFFNLPFEKPSIDLIRYKWK